jgi:lipopolysaccharide/colanic/teichoic acid biosynthesis glycosyltransferase
MVRPMPRWKRVLDVLGAAAGLVVLAPVMAAAALAVMLTSPGPILFTQRRAGLGGRAFTIFKFRTMSADAEARKAELRPKSERDGPAFKLSADPRVTAVGRFLRSTSIDELPQLWNVLRGEMSLVGPRPLPLDESDGCTRWQRHRLDVTPGLTCIWQVSGRSTVSFAQWVRMDMAYIRRRTLLHDVWILVKTVPAVILRRGAW